MPNDKTAEMKTAEEQHIKGLSIIPKLAVTGQWRAFSIDYIREIQLDAFKAGMREAASMLQKRLDDYTKEHGIYDGETGQTEYPGNGLEYVTELEEQIETILTAADAKKGV